MEKAALFAPYRGRPLPAATLLGLADISFFALLRAETSFAPLGYRLDRDELERLAADALAVRRQRAFLEKKGDRNPAEEEAYETAKKLDRSAEAFRAALSIEAPELPGEAGLAASSLKSLTLYARSGEDSSSASVSTVGYVNDLYLLFLMAQFRGGAADRVFDWLLAADWGYLVENTLRHHLAAHAGSPPSAPPADGRLYKKQLLELAVRVSA